MEQDRKDRQTNITEKNSQMHLAHKQTRLRQMLSSRFLKFLLEQEWHMYNKDSLFVTNTAQKGSFGVFKWG